MAVSCFLLGVFWCFILIFFVGYLEHSDVVMDLFPEPRRKTVFLLFDLGGKKELIYFWVLWIISDFFGLVNNWIGENASFGRLIFDIYGCESLSCKESADFGNYPLIHLKPHKNCQINSTNLLSKFKINEIASRHSTGSFPLLSTKNNIISDSYLP